MTSAERVLAATEHREPDRVPVDFWWSVEMKDKLLRHLGLGTVDELQDYLGSDLRCVYPAYAGPDLRRFEDGSFEDFWGVIRSPFRYETGGTYYEVMSPALADATSLDDIELLRWPDPDWFDYDSLAGECDRYPDHAIVVGKMGRECQTLFIQLWYYRGLENSLMDLVAWPEMVEALVARIMAFRLEHLKRILAAARGRAHILQLADDYGAQGGLMLSRAVEAADALAGEGVQARVLNFSSVKPLDTRAIERAVRETAGIVVAEEHSVLGGLGSAVAEAATGTAPARIERVGVRDTFGESGQPEALLEKYGLTSEAICEAARKLTGT